MALIDPSLHILPNDTPFVQLNCKNAFENLSPAERLYAHHIARASFVGSLIVFLQVSPESAGIFVLLYRLFSSEPIEAVKAKALEAGFTDEEWRSLLVWTSGVFSNKGNYRSFGDSKIIPNVTTDSLKQLIATSKAASNFNDLISMYAFVENGIFTLNKRTVGLGFNDTGVTTYHSESVTKDDSDLINRFMKKKNIEGWNTRLFKEVIDGRITLTIKSASIIANSTEENFEGVTVRLESGDYSEILARVCDHLKKAGDYAADNNQRALMEKYVEHFTSGDVNDHKDASRLWINDVDPIVESYIGFIENYRDPAGVRAEFDGLVAVVNKDTSIEFTKLVNKAEEFLERLPWGKAYEKDTFLKPDFTALDVIALAGSSLYIGKNMPNYDDIRQSEGFKNVVLSNILYAKPRQRINFLSEADENLIFEYGGRSLEIQTALHELLGHGSGKLFQMNADGSFNFDQDNAEDILTGGNITSWYQPGETWASVFGQLSNPYEECRAEAVGYVLCGEEDILKIFGYEGETARKITQANWLNELYAGLTSLEQYNAETEKWGQAHSWARFVLLRVTMEAGQGFVTINETKDGEGKDDLSFKMDYAKIDRAGLPAVREFLKKLQAHKSTADVKGGTALFNTYSVDATALKWREIVLAKRKPRLMFVQVNTRLTEDGTNVELVTYPETAEGVIQSVVERFSPEAVSDLEKLWKADQKYFPSAYEGSTASSQGMPIPLNWMIIVVMLCISLLL